jgi:hypothetical protein
MQKQIVINILLLTTLFFLTQCFTYHSNWHIPESKEVKISVTKLHKKADTLIFSANTKEKLLKVIDIYETILEAEPQNHKALYELGHLYLLVGDGYSQKRSEKKDCFKKALNYNEHAMYTNPLFKKKIDSGSDVWQAAVVLTEKDMDLMLFWTTAVFYYYKECLGAFGQMINYHWIRRAKKMMEFMYDTNPDYAGGAPHFTWALYYLSIPKSVGGNKIKSEELFAKAIEVGPDWLLNRWGRAKYFHVKMQNREAFRQDLEWILKQDLNKLNGHPAWKIYFINDAHNMLTNIDKYF